MRPCGVCNRSKLSRGIDHGEKDNHADPDYGVAGCHINCFPGFRNTA